MIQLGNKRHDVICVTLALFVYFRRKVSVYIHISMCENDFGLEGVWNDV